MKLKSTELQRKDKDIFLVCIRMLTREWNKNVALTQDQLRVYTWIKWVFKAVAKEFDLFSSHSQETGVKTN